MNILLLVSGYISSARVFKFFLIEFFFSFFFLRKKR